MSKVYLSHNNIVSSLGLDSKTVVDAIRDETSGLGLVRDRTLLHEPFYASRIDRTLLAEEFNTLDPKGNYTLLEQMMILSLSKVVGASKIPLTHRTGLLISTTKGNVDVLGNDSPFP